MNKKLLSSLLLVGLVAGCANTNTNSSSANKNTSTNSSSSVVEENSSTSVNVNSSTSSGSTSVNVSISSDVASNTSSSVVSSDVASNTSSSVVSSDVASNTSSSVVSSDVASNTSSSVVSSDDTSSDVEVEYNATVYYYNTNGWTNVNCYSWDSNGGLLDAWPGTPMTPVEGKDNWFEITYIAGDSFNVIFNNGSAQTPDIAATSENKYFFGNSVIGYTSFEEAEEASQTTPDTEITIYFANSENWTTVYCYAWLGGSSNGGWPGVEMTDEGNNIYSYTLDSALYGNVIFGDGTSQTIDISLSGITDNTLFSLDSLVEGKWTCTTSEYTA